MFFFAYGRNAFDSLRCFSFIPYGMSDGFVSLPFDREFCFKYSNRYIEMKTNRFGARLLDAGHYEQTALAFGESQLLGMDASDTDGQHDLSALFSDHNFEIYAAPNNGPFEALERVNDLGQQITIGNKTVVVGFNFGTDIFRIRSNWDPRNFVPVDSEVLNWTFMIPGLHDILLFHARLKGVKFGSTVSDSDSVRKYYFAMTDRERGINTLNWLKAVSQSKLMEARERALILFPPYWYINASDTQKLEIKNDYHTFACNILEANIFHKVLYAELPEGENVLTRDNRHFRTGTLNYLSYTC